MERSRSEATLHLPRYKERLIPHIIDDLALHEPGRTYALAAHTLDDGDTPQDITFLHLSNAINKCAFWLKEQCEEILTEDENVTVAYLSRSDLRTCILIVAAIKVGIKVGGKDFILWEPRVGHAATVTPLPLMLTT